MRMMYRRSGGPVGSAAWPMAWALDIYKGLCPGPGPAPAGPPPPHSILPPPTNTLPSRALLYLGEQSGKGGGGREGGRGRPTGRPLAFCLSASSPFSRVDFFGYSRGIRPFPARGNAIWPFSFLSYSRGIRLPEAGVYFFFVSFSISFAFSSHTRIPSSSKAAIGRISPLFFERSGSFSHPLLSPSLLWSCVRGPWTVDAGPGDGRSGAERVFFSVSVCT